jgi:hypothetical protein
MFPDCQSPPGAEVMILKIFSPKKSEKLSNLTQNTSTLCQKVITALTSVASCVHMYTEIGIVIICSEVSKSKKVLILFM